jgi:RNA polymerase sigma factor (sigma-70 family)
MVTRAQAPHHTHDAMSDLARRYRDPLLRYFVRRGISADAAEDCVHDVFVRLAKKSLEGVANHEAYLFTTASSVILDRARRAVVRAEGKHDPIEDFDFDSGAPWPARVFEGKEALRQLARILDELPERTKEIFLLSRLDRLTNTQLAARYGISVSSIEKHMTKALSYLRARYRDE